MINEFPDIPARMEDWYNLNLNMVNPTIQLKTFYLKDTVCNELNFPLGSLPNLGVGHNLEIIGEFYTPNTVSSSVTATILTFWFDEAVIY